MWCLKRNSRKQKSWKKIWIGIGKEMDSGLK